eukprot:symbB.v1.2.036166.t1/scaffold5043.1/size31561/2
MARLDLVVGTWIDQKESQYVVEKDVGAETCSVCTYRKSGETQRTQRLIRMSGGKVPTLPRGDVGRCGEGVGVYKM